MALPPRLPFFVDLAEECFRFVVLCAEVCGADAWDGCPALIRSRVPIRKNQIVFGIFNAILRPPPIGEN